MEEISVANVLWFIATLLLGFFIKTMWERISVLNKRVDNWSTLMPETYVRRDDYRDDIRDIKEMLGKIFDRLEMKADK
tara:strand:- start:11590 stop:11823 length:234 start_codon:yes stop_codon:yes gene_type:complete